MPRKRRHAPLDVLLNGRLVGQLTKAPSGAIDFRYAREWLEWEHAFPVSLSLALREDAYRGEPVVAVFDNLLPDSDRIRRRVAEKVGADGTDAYSLLAAIGHDCVGALQFLPADAPEPLDRSSANRLDGEPVDDEAIERLLNGLAQAPLGLNRDDDFRISVAGAQEKTALLRLRDQWIKPHGLTPTTHIFKAPIGMLPNGIDLSHSVENEYYCLRLAEAFGLPVNRAEICTFGKTQALVVERFDRRWAGEDRLLRLPQEDMCQALSIPPTRKYQSDGGPNLKQLFELLKGSDRPAVDHATILRAQIYFYLIGATDGHAKNFSLFINPGGAYRLTPLYDILTAQPSLDSGHIERNQMRLAMSVGASRHYRFHEVLGRHFEQTTHDARVPAQVAREIIEDMAARAEAALDVVEQGLPANFPSFIHNSVRKAVLERTQRLRM